MNNKEICVRCMIPVANEDKGIQCDSCDRWSHSKSFKIYDENPYDIHLKLYCNRDFC